MISKSLGSPPLTRGTLYSKIIYLSHIRITPAYAGNTLCEFFRTAPLWDHPRLRGEHLTLMYGKLAEQGSPPLTRGTRFEYKTAAFVWGITPAYAGNTAVGTLNAFEQEDHPRLRGEHHIRKGKPLRSLGSPPLTRGTLFSSYFIFFYFRITPAYAGNTVRRPSAN